MNSQTIKFYIMYLKISNTGNVSPEAFSLVGASTKRGNNGKIGMFGSGNKYAIAYLVRNEYDFKVFTGNGEIKFTTVETKLNNDVFNVICINDKETSITSEMGPQWTLWQVLREIYSNAMDEGIIHFGLVDGFDEPTENQTDFYIQLKDELRDIYENINDYFAINKEVLFECDFGKIYKKSSPNTCVYRKGIRCFDTKTPSMFDYDFNDIEINETRVLKYSWQLPEYVWKILYQCDNAYVIRTVFNKINTASFIEQNIDDSFVSTYASEMSKEWGEAIKTSKVAPQTLSGYVKDEDVAKTYLVPTKLYHDLVSKHGEEVKPSSFRETSKGVNYSTTDLTPLMIEMLKDVTAFFKECKFDIPYPIDVVRFMDADVHGGIKDETILISKNAFEKGKTWIANIIIEEYIHIKHDAPDKSRKFQDDVINEFLTYMKSINSYNL